MSDQPMTKLKMPRIPCIAGLAFALLLLILIGGTWAISILLQRSPDPLQELRSLSLYPNAQSIKVTESSDTDAALTFKAPATSGEVFAFYEAQLNSAAGWMAHPGGPSNDAGFFRLYFKSEERFAGFEFKGVGGPPFFGAPWFGPKHERAWHIVYVTTRVPLPSSTQSGDFNRLPDPSVASVESVELYVHIVPGSDNVPIKPR